jgi:hypothetical protein
MPLDWKPLKSSPKKGVSALVAAFFLIQITIDLTHSVTAFPFVHYGMFSESVGAPDSLLSYEVTVDGRRLAPLGFRIYQWDMIQQPLQAFDRQTATGDFEFDKSKLRQAFPTLYAALSDNFDNLPYPEARFPDWYANYLSLQLGHPIRTLEVSKTWYRYQNGRMIELSRSLWIKR